MQAVMRADSYFTWKFTGNRRMATEQLQPAS